MKIQCALLVVLLLGLSVDANPSLKYARPHAGTRYLEGSAQRYAPQEWPKWWTWTMYRGGSAFQYVMPSAG